MRFRKIYAIVPDELYQKLVNRDIFKQDFDGLVCDLLIRYLEYGCDRSDSRNENNK